MTLNKILKGIAVASVFSVLIIPFIVASNSFFPFITGKGFFFRAIVEIGFAAWLILTFTDASVRPRKSLILWSFVGFVAIIGVANIFGMSPWKSFWSNFERMEGYITILHLFLYFIVASSVLATERIWKAFLESSLWASFAVSFYAVFQLLGKLTINQGGVRVDATFGNATYLAIYLIFNIFFALILINRENPLWKKITFGLISALHLIILYHTATRGAILGILGGLFLSAVLIALFDKGESRKRIFAGVGVSLVVLVVLGFIGIKNTDFVKKSPVLSRFSSLSINDARTQARGYVWPMAIVGWKERPILGWGQENFNYVFNKNYDPRMYTQEQWFDHAHNIILDWLVAGGILGLLAYLSLFVSVVYLLWKKTSEMAFTEKALFTGLGAAYMFHNLFVFDNLVSYILFVIVLAFIHFKSTRLSQPIAKEKDELDASDLRMAAPIIVVGLIFALYFFVWRGYATATTMIDALRAANSNPVQAEATVAAFEDTLKYDSLGRPEVVERMIEATRQVNTPNVPIEVRQKYLKMTNDALITQLTRFPGDARYETFAGNFYSMSGDIAKAQEHLENAVELSPRKQTILFQLGSIYISSKQYDKAVEVFKKAYELEPNFSEALRFYAASLIYIGKEDEAKKMLGLTNENYLLSDAFLTAYADMGKWDQVVVMLKARIAVDPTNNQNRMNLVAAYYQMGNRPMAVATLKELIVIDPLGKATYETYIQQIQGGQ